MTLYGESETKCECCEAVVAGQQEQFKMSTCIYCERLLCSGCENHCDDCGDTRCIECSQDQDKICNCDDDDQQSSVIISGYKNRVTGKG